ncbi:MAG: stage II sporulation protein M [Candidatus Woesearchaeota archaeon]
MVLESFINPFKAEQHPSRMFFLGLLYFTISIFLSLLVFRTYSSLMMVFFTTMASIPLIYNTLKMEEEKDLKDLTETALLKEHSRALSFFMVLFLGITTAAVFWYVVLPPDTVSILFESQTNTITSINGGVVGAAFRVNLGVFGHILLNNFKVMVFCILFSFIYGSGAIFILSWNATVIGTAIGNFIRTNLALATSMLGLEKAGHYFQIISIGLFKYAIHGIPEILAYFTAGLAGGIISVALIKHDFGTRKFEHILFDSADLLIISLLMLVLAAFLEVYVTPVIF